MLIFLQRSCTVDYVSADEESSTESRDDLEDGDTSRSATADHHQLQSTLQSPSTMTAQIDRSDTTNEGLKPTFSMTDYKQPKRCKKGNCTFQTVSKVSREVDSRYCCVTNYFSIC